jgi:hypothetical protein
VTRYRRQLRRVATTTPSSGRYADDTSGRDTAVP